MTNTFFIEDQKNSILLFDGSKATMLFNEEEYNDILSHHGKYHVFDIVIKEYNITNTKEILDRFLPIFNSVLITNISNFIIDQYKEKKIQQIVFNKQLKNDEGRILTTKDFLKSGTVLRGLLIQLLHSNEYLEGNLTMEYMAIPNNLEMIFKKIPLKNIFYYQATAITKIKNKLINDLIAFQFVHPQKVDRNGRFILPVYIDEDSLISQGIVHHHEFNLHNLSLAYLKMLNKIHDFFIDYYQLEEEKKMKLNDVMICLIDLLVAQIEDFPKGLKKSIEVGRQTSGKCFFIDHMISPIVITEELALILQSKDIFSVVPRLFKR